MLPYYRLLLITLVVFATSCGGYTVNEDFVHVCKAEDSIKVIYMDSKIISEVDAQTNNDTLSLTLSLSYGQQEQGNMIHISANTRNIKYANTTLTVEELHSCHIVYSGEEAL